MIETKPSAMTTFESILFSLDLINLSRKNWNLFFVFFFVKSNENKKHFRQVFINTRIASLERHVLACLIGIDSFVTHFVILNFVTYLENRGFVFYLI